MDDKEKMIGLVDGNNFYVSCERIFDLSLESKPVAVLSNNDGCVISRSNEFKALNIPMGTPFFQLKPFIKYHGLILKSSNYELYGDISRRMIAVLQEFAPEVEQYSIDEAFIKVQLSGDADYLGYGQIIRSSILQWIGIPCGIGFAKTKTLAKIANHIGKKQTGGVFVMPDNPEEVLSTLPVAEIWGVGRKLAPKLEKWGIRTAWQLATQEDAFLRKRFNVSLARTALELRGMPAIEDHDPEDISQSISCSRSFGHPVIAFTELVESIAHYTARSAEKLRKEGLRASGANVFFQYYPEYEPRKLEGGFSATTVAFEVPTSSTSAMIKAITPKLKGLFIEGRRYKKSGVVFFGLESGDTQQLDLFSSVAVDDKADSLSAAIDKINRQFGKGTLFHMAEGIKKPWAMKRDHLSPNYTTNWDQLPVVR
jgi:DNA polymerase V